MPAGIVGDLALWLLERSYGEDTLVASGARTASGDTGPLPDYGRSNTLRLQLNVTAVAGTSPTLDVLVEDTLDGTNWNTVGTFAQKTAVGREVVNVTAPFAKRLRVSWSITGTGPSFTFEVICVSRAPNA